MYLYVPVYLARPGRAACIRREVHSHTQPKMILVRILIVCVGSTSHDIFITYLYLPLPTITYCTYLHVSTLRLSALLVTSDHSSYLLLSSSSSSPPPPPPSSSSLSVTSFTLGGKHISFVHIPTYHTRLTLRLRHAFQLTRPPVTSSFFRIYFAGHPRRDCCCCCCCY